MNNSLLNQQLIPEVGSKQFIEALDLFLMTYGEVILGFIFIVLICAVGLAMIESRQRHTGNPQFTAQSQRLQPPNRRQSFTNSYETLRMEHDSIA
jgi:hypothetical protein